MYSIAFVSFCFGIISVEVGRPQDDANVTRSTIM